MTHGKGSKNYGNIVQQDGFYWFHCCGSLHTRANSLFIITDGIMVITLSLLSPTISLTLHRRLMDKPHCSTCDINQASEEERKTQ